MESCRNVGQEQNWDEVGNDVEIMGKNTNQDFVQNIGEMFNLEMKPINEANPSVDICYF